MCTWPAENNTSTTDRSDELVTADTVERGDWLDLEGDSVADPDRSDVSLQWQYAQVDDVEVNEDTGTVTIHTSLGTWDFPADHKVVLVGQ